MLMFILVANALSCAGAQYYPPESKFVSAFIRQFFPGGPHSVMFRGSFNSTYNPYAFHGPLVTHPDGLKEQTFLSRPLEMLPGEIINNYSPINWPEGKIAIKSYSGDVVKLAPHAQIDDLGNDGFPNVVPASREEVYLHHWTVNKWQLGKADYDALVNSSGRDFTNPGPDSGMNNGANSPCGEALLHFIFGAGNEVRGPPPSGANSTYFFPDPYGIESDSDFMHKNGIVMLFNAHLIDIRGVSQEARRGCVECECNVTGAHHGGKNYTGGLECCHSTASDGGRCPVSASFPQQRESYFVKYTLTWRDQEDPLYQTQPFKPLNAMTLDQSDDSPTWFDAFEFPGSSLQSHDALKNDAASMASLLSRHSGMGGDGHLSIHNGHIQDGPHACHVEYWVPPCKPEAPCVHRFVNSWKIPYDMEIVAVHNHYHIAAINMTTTVEGGEQICVGLPTYKDGFLIENSNCRVGRKKDKQMPVVVRKGQNVRVETFYNQDQRPHFGVMGFAMMYVHRADIHSTSAMLV